MRGMVVLENIYRGLWEAWPYLKTLIGIMRSMAVLGVFKLFFKLYFLNHSSLQPFTVSIRLHGHYMTVTERFGASIDGYKR
jgi:hypothetical protein